MNVKRGSIIEAREHSEIDEVQFLDLDCGYRVVSGGMDCVKIWEFKDSNESDGKYRSNDDDSEGEITSESDSENTLSGEWQSSDDTESGSQFVPNDQISKLSSREELLAELAEDEGSGEDEFATEGQQGATDVKKRGVQEEVNRKKRGKKRKITRKGATPSPAYGNLIIFRCRVDL